MMKRKISKVWGLMAALLLPVSAMSQTETTSNVLNLSLEEAIEIAVSENPTIIVADQQIELKKISKQETWQSLLPSVDFSGTVQYTVLAAVMKLNDMEFKMGKDNTSTWNGQFSVSLPIFAPTVYATSSSSTNIAPPIKSNLS